LQLRSYEYRRLVDVFRDLAQQSDSETLQDRWSNMAQACLDRAGDGERIRYSHATTLSFDTAETTVVEMAPPTYTRLFHLPMVCAD
jgi:hypothetical protein